MKLRTKTKTQMFLSFFLTRKNCANIFSELQKKNLIFAFSLFKYWQIEIYRPKKWVGASHNLIFVQDCKLYLVHKI